MYIRILEFSPFFGRVFLANRPCHCTFSFFFLVRLPSVSSFVPGRGQGSKNWDRIGHTRGMGWDGGSWGKPSFFRFTRGFFYFWLYDDDDE